MRTDLLASNIAPDANIDRQLRFRVMKNIMELLVQKLLKKPQGLSVLVSQFFIKTHKKN